MKRISNDEYKDYFLLNDQNSDKMIFEKALLYAIDTRKLEIELYWKRATYFWTLIAIAFAGYFALYTTDKKFEEKPFFAFVIGCIGFVFTWAWFMVNRGSKYWQENWENHVDMLEDPVIGPLFKTIMHRPPDQTFCDKYITGPSAKSPSKINQWVSVFTLIIWVLLILNTLLASYTISVTIKFHVVGIITIIFAFLLAYKSKTYDGKLEHIAELRESSIVNPNNK